MMNIGITLSVFSFINLFLVANLIIKLFSITQDNLRQLAEWWRLERWFGMFDSVMRDRMRKACYFQLQMHQHNQPTLLQLTLELLLCHEAGYSLMNRVGQNDFILYIHSEY